MRYLFLVTFFYAFLHAATPADLNVIQKNDETNMTKIYIPTYYKDFKWDVGVIGGLTFDGTQIDYQRYTLGLGLHVAYHYNESVSFHGEYIDYFKTIAGSQYNSDQAEIVDTLTTTNIAALSVAYDFSADRTYSLFAKGGLGYEFKDDSDAQEPKAAVSLLGFGFRYMFTERMSGYLEGRWKMRLSNISEPDNSLIGTIGLDYHFGLSDEKAKLIAEADAHNTEVDRILEERAETKRQKELSK